MISAIPQLTYQPRGGPSDLIDLNGFSEITGFYTVLDEVVEYKPEMIRRVSSEIRGILETSGLLVCHAYILLCYYSPVM
jgi:hypothetical protein